MKTKNNNKKNNIIMCIISGAIGGFFGFYLCDGIATYLQSMNLFSNDIIALLVTIFIGYIIITIVTLKQIIFHELGHLVFGLLSGYEFKSFRIASFIWVKQDGKIKFKRYSLPGTIGQCLMKPPAEYTDSIKTFSYNMGGVFFNAILCVMAGIIALFLDKDGIVFISYIAFIATGLFFIITNGLPIKMGPIPNDALNVVSLKDNSAKNSFWKQMTVNALITEQRLKDMPDELFTYDEDKLDNALVSTTAVFDFNREVDKHNFDTAKQKATHLLEKEGTLIPMYENIIKVELMFIEVMGECREEVIEELLTKDVQTFLKSVKNQLPCIRAVYAYYKIYKKDEDMAKKYELDFERVAKNYPYPADLESERELMALASQKCLL